VEEQALYTILAVEFFLSVPYERSFRANAVSELEEVAVLLFTKCNI